MLQGKTAIITGVSRGIGKAIALTFAYPGAFVCINYVAGKDKAQQLLDTIKEQNGCGMLLPGDVRKDAPKIIRAFRTQKRKIDILVNNAEAYKRGPFSSISP